MLLSQRWASSNGNDSLHNNFVYLFRKHIDMLSERPVCSSLQFIIVFIFFTLG